MPLRDWALEMAQYNRWQNAVLFGLCEELTREQLHQQKPVFFGSIHNTLDHILLADVWNWQFVTSGELPGESFNPRERMHEDFDDLAAHRASFDQIVIERLSAESDDWFDDKVSARRAATKPTRRYPRFFVLAQSFNHATHHRSQVTSELFRRGIDYGTTDMPDCPSAGY